MDRVVYLCGIGSLGDVFVYIVILVVWATGINSCFVGSWLVGDSGRDYGNQKPDFAVVYG